MNDTPKVSIIVPVHNAETTISTCIESIAGQTYDNIECILIENGSADGSIKLCREYSERHDFIRLAVSPKAGVSEARNLGLSLATGEIIGFCDADDFMEPDAVKTVVSEFVKKPDIIGVIGAFYVGRGSFDGIQKQYRGLRKQEISAGKAIALTIGSDAVMGSVWNKYYKADILRGSSFNPELTYCEDTHFNANVLSGVAGDRRLMLISNPLYCYMQNDQSVTHQASNFFDENGSLKYIIALKRILSDCNLDRRCKSIVRMRIAGLAAEYFFKPYVNKQQQIELIKELKENYRYLLCNFARFHWKSDFKRSIKGLIALVKYKMANGKHE